ncbi:hypothetical protein C8Q80DRAFT_1213646 [Daedaleopsis nitida]|nr:hypothetical protein C8Q80DRAFT_1213646 [Daedaleopsis nitida]
MQLQVRTVIADPVRHASCNDSSDINRGDQWPQIYSDFKSEHNIESCKTTPRIAIVDGGVSGLVLLLTLHRHGIPATLYERESGYSSRAYLGVSRWHSRSRLDFRSTGAP